MYGFGNDLKLACCADLPVDTVGAAGFLTNCATSPNPFLTA
jgi:hypothetical protein